MMKRKVLSMLVGVAMYGSLSAAMASPPLTNSELISVVKFLTSDKMLTNSKENKKIPLSYYIGSPTDVAKYFGGICSDDNSCQVNDIVFDNPFAILGEGAKDGVPQHLKAAQSQIERIDMAHGSNIYDAATWQIAIALAGANNVIGLARASELVNNENSNLTYCPAVDNCNRATNKQFKYGYKNSVTDPAKAFNYRMLAKDFILKDPFFGTTYQDKITWAYDPEQMAENDPNKHTADYFTYVNTWSDYKPVLGENAWAQLIGPLQAEAILRQGKVADNSTALKNALNTLSTFSAMQSGVGALYYAPDGSLGNMGPITKGQISLENNFSVLGGLQILKTVLNQVAPTAEVNAAKKLIDTTLYGGTTVNGVATVGLLSFLYNGAFDRSAGLFRTSGIASDPTLQTGWRPDTPNASTEAVDVNTWGVLALGPETVDHWFGAGTANKIWQNVKNQGGYFSQGKLWGVGFTLNNRTDKIMSVEWTAGAIRMVDALIAYYKVQNVDVSDLKNDLDAMQKGIQMLRNDRYQSAGFDNATSLPRYVTLPPDQGIGYLYASKRWLIPFGWYANTLPSLTANAWIVMNQYTFNPFQFMGKLSGENYPTPAQRDISGGGSSSPDKLPVAVSVTFDSGDLQTPLSGLALSYSMSADGDNNWVPAGTASPGQGKLSGTGSLPQGALRLGMAYQATNGQWYGACQLKPAGKLCADQLCSTVKTLSARWSANGAGDCSVNAK